VSTDHLVGDALDDEPVLTLEEAPRVIAPRGPIRQWWATHPTIAYVIRRFGIYVLTLWAAITATFFFFRLIPGDLKNKKKS